MKLKVVFNPWGENRRLREHNAYLSGLLDEMDRQLDCAQRDAFERAAAHYYQRSRMVEAQLEATQKRLADILACLPPTPISIPANRPPADRLTD